MDEARIIIEQNVKGIEGSFIHDLHERNMFNMSAFKAYVDAITQLTQQAQDDQMIERALMDQVFFTYSYILKSVIWHLDMNDHSSIENVSDEQLTEMIERLETVVRKFIQGNEK
ncbi:Imm41 family immunity protein [Paenibacillus sp. KACC 21273]|uniref:Imm41 family immunity protein n=1 Tax=Paenibacillus sp. KACC 21273 TaxID=3025665 RepID=UPI002366EA38|nr:Imm41 family immunity protein [Paenibacillus sp. KACC 21273]WDF49124.1 Imm41 family immunity protein [Paenibacillus sp. KACC 21273]